jgi:signal transduction histidine kinase
MAEELPEGQELNPDEIQRRGGLVLRTLPILLIPVVVGLITAILVRLTFGESDLPPKPPPDVPPPVFFPLVPIVVLVIFCTSLIVLVRLRRPTISAIVMIGVWTLFTTLGALRSGVTSIFPALLILPICAAGLLIDGAASVSLAALATVLVASMAWLEYQGLSLPMPPPGALVEQLQFVAASFWIGIFWSIAALTVLLSGSLQRALRQSRSQAQALKELSGQLEARVAAQTALLLAQAQETATMEERTRLAREIHDTLAQGLAGISVQLGAAQRALAHMPAEAPQHLDLAQRMAREALAEARRSVWNLRSQALARGDLADALRGLAAHPPGSELRVSFERQGQPWPLPPAAESALLRVAQEALANAHKHAAAEQVAITLSYTPEHVLLEIHDDGVGFDAPILARQASTPGPQGGFGLLGMRERLAAMGGALELRNESGALVRACVPRQSESEGKESA